MANIKDSKKEKDKVQPTTDSKLSHISFSLKYFTTNKEHCFSYFRNDMRNRHEAYEALFQKMRELCQIDSTQAKLDGKIVGCEPIPYKRLSSTMQSICDGVEIISKDSSLAVFRFYQNNYRLLCKTDLIHPNLLHVIAIDFNYTAYDHG